MTIIRKFFDLPLGTRFRYIGGTDVWVILERHGCGKVAKYEPHDGWVAGQSICSAVNYEKDCRTLEVEVVVDEPKTQIEHCLNIDPQSTPPVWLTVDGVPYGRVSDEDRQTVLGVIAWLQGAAQGDRPNISRGQAAEALQRLLSAQPAVQVPQWISVKERLPEFDFAGNTTRTLVEVIAALVDGTVCPMIYRANSWTAEESKPSWSFAGGGTCRSHHITHWMPLPASPTPYGYSIRRSGRMSDLIQRLRCRYPMGPIQENGEPEFGWREMGGIMPPGAVIPLPIMKEAADRIEALEREKTDMRKHLADALNTMLWLYRRLPRSYDSPPHVVQSIKALAQQTGTDLAYFLDERDKAVAAPGASDHGGREG